ncbi:MAG: Dna2/Cas4 domain-containing protein [Nitrososphaera sp.]|jgi:CRISPR-associated exonuclease Cas4
MMGDRDYHRIISAAADALAKETSFEVPNPADNKTIFLHEVVRCMRRSYFDRFDKREQEDRSFMEMVGGLIRKLPYGAKAGEFAIEDIKLKGQADMIVDDIVLIFKKTSAQPETPDASDVLYLNACMWIYNKTDGVIVYLTNEKESSFVVMRDKKMFEETIRRVRVFSNLIAEKKPPILEPSAECSGCQYYERCYIKKHEGKQFSLAELFGQKK